MDWALKEGIEPAKKWDVKHEEVDTSDKAVRLSWGIDNAVYLEGKPFRPYAPPWTSDELRAEIIQIAENKNLNTK